MIRKHDFTRHSAVRSLLMRSLRAARLVPAAACIVLTLASVRLPAQAPAPAKGGETLIFTFAPGEDLFTLRGNEAELERLYAWVDEYRAEIAAGRMPLYVDGYCASQPNPADNLLTAYLRASRVKSELIIQKGLTEADFVTGNYAKAYGDHKDVVVVTLRLSAPDTAAIPSDTTVILSEAKDLEPQHDTAVIRSDTAVIPSEAKDLQPQRDTAVIPGEAKDLEPQRAEQEMLHSVQQDTPLYRFALRTNLLYDALLLPTLGVEWRIDPDFGIRLDGSLSHWGGATGKVQKVWLLNPELRRYLLRDRRFYVGLSGSYGEYNIYKYPLGSLLKDGTGYQGHLWNAGVSVGYQLRLCRQLSADFNLGLGYTRSEYDSFTLTEGARISKQRDQKKSFWGPTQAGIHLVWTIGGKK